MRIISGKWGGRKLVKFMSNEIRPTTDRVKETIFNIVGPDIIGAKVLDLFTGTGSLSFEAISRGAKVVLSVDSGDDSRKIFLKNKALLCAGDDSIYKSEDVFLFLTKVEESFDYILIDPPFVKKIGVKVLKALAESKAFHKDSWVFIEYAKGEETVDEWESLIVKKTRVYGDKSLYTYVVKNM